MRCRNVEDGDGRTLCNKSSLVDYRSFVSSRSIYSSMGQTPPWAIPYCFDISASRGGICPIDR